MRGGRIIALLGVVALLSSCSPAAQPAAQAPVTPAAERRAANQVITVGQLGLPATMTPESTSSFLPVFGTTFDALTWLDGKSNILPQVAERWEQTTPETWRFTIRQGLTFSNGDPLTAEDVAFTTKLMLDTRMPQIRYFPSLVDVRLIDPNTVDFISRIPDASVLAGGGSLWIMPKKYYEQVGKNGYAAKPIGSGPYELVEMQTNDRVVVKKRPTAHPFRNPVASQVTFRAIPQPSALIAGIRTGDLDLIDAILSPDLLDTIAQSDLVITSEAWGTMAIHIPQPEAQQRGTPLTDRRVRLALNYAVDKQALADKLYKGKAIPTSVLTVPTSPGWDESVKPFPYDVAMAKRLLAEAGYPNGFRLPTGLDFSPAGADPAIPQAIQAYLKEIGVDVTINSLEVATFLDKVSARDGLTRSDLFITVTGDSNGFGTAAFGAYTCSKPPATIYFCSQQYDRDMQLALREADREKRATLMRAALLALREEAAQLMLFVVPTFIVHPPKIKGLVRESSFYYTFDSIYRIE